MNAELVAVIAQLAAAVVKMLPNLLRAIRDQDEREAERLLRRALLAQAAKIAVRRGTRKP